MKYIENNSKNLQDSFYDRSHLFFIAMPRYKKYSMNETFRFLYLTVENAFSIKQWP